MCTIAPDLAFKPLAEQKEAPINEKYNEIRFSKEKGEKIDVGMFIYFFFRSFHVKGVYIYKKNIIKSLFLQWWRNHLHLPKVYPKS